MSYLTPAQVAQALAVSPNTIRDWARSGLVEHFKSPTNGAIRIPQSEFERLVKENTVKARI